MIETIKMSEFIDGGDIENNNTTIGLEDSNNVRFNNPWTFLKPGSTGDRPAPSSAIDYRLRLNTTLESYEYYSPVLAEWIQIQDSIDVQTFPFVIYTDEPLLPNSFNLGSLGDGILKQSVLAGVATPAIAINGTDYYGPGYTGYINAPQGFKGEFDEITLKLNSYGASSVNYLQIENSISGLPVTMRALGSDPDVEIDYYSKGIAIHSFYTLGSTPAFNWNTGTTYQHVTSFSFPDTANNVNVTFQDFSGTLAYLSDIPNKGYATTVTAASTTTLTSLSAYQQYFTGATTQTVVMPDVTTLVLGQSWQITNNSTGNVTIQSSGSNQIIILGSGETIIITCISLTGTDSSSWNVKLIVAGKYLTITNSIGVALTTTTNTDITSITLDSGDWDVTASIIFGPNAFNITLAQGWLNTISATPPSFNYFEITPANPVALTGSPVPGIRVTVPSGTTQTVYLSGNASFGSGAVTGFGEIKARRVKFI